MKALSVLAGMLLGVTLSAQNGPPEPRFDVVSIKRSTMVLPGPTFGNAPGGGGFSMTSGPILSVIYTAYSTRNRNIVGLPDWVRNDRYDIIATTTRTRTREEEGAMLRVLLAERMAFRGHVEDRELPVFALTLGTSEPKPTLQRLAVDCAGYVGALRRGEKSPAAPLPDGSAPCGYSVQSGAATVITSKGMTLSALADLLGNAAGRVVVDRTNLQGDYTFVLTYGTSRPTAAGADEAPVIFTAVQEQLGLKLEPARAPIETLVIDHIERPTEN